MIRAPTPRNQRLEVDIEACDRRLADIERRGNELDREHQETVEYSKLCSFLVISRIWLDWFVIVAEFSIKGGIELWYN